MRVYVLRVGEKERGGGGGGWVSLVLHQAIPVQSRGRGLVSPLPHHQLPVPPPPRFTITQ